MKDGMFGLCDAGCDVEEPEYGKKPVLIFEEEEVKNQTEARNLKHGLIALSLFTVILIIVIPIMLLKYSKMKKRIKDLQMKVSTFEENKPRNIATATDGGLQRQPYDDLDILDEGQPMKAN